MELIIKNLDEIEQVAAKFIKLSEGYNIVAFYGSMGAGKTTFIKSICNILGVSDTVSSPTFSLVNEYQSNSGKLIYHFDFYRINNLEEVYDFGYEEYFYSEQLCLIEWPELIEELLPEHCLKVNLEEKPDGSRILKINIQD